MNRLRGLALLLLQSVTTPLFALSMLLCAPLGVATMYALARRWCSLNVQAARLLGMPYQLETEGALPDQPAVILAKHSSAWETFFLVKHFPRLVPVVKRELLRVPFFGWGLALVQPIAIDRSARREARSQLTEQGRARLRSGLWIMIFPEGTRIPAGQRGRYASGGASVAIDCGAPVVAVAHDAGFYWRKSLFDKRGGTIRVAISAPMWPAPGEDATALTRRAEAWIEGRIEAWGHAPAALTAKARAAQARERLGRADSGETLADSGEEEGESERLEAGHGDAQ